MPGVVIVLGNLCLKVTVVRLLSSVHCQPLLVAEQSSSELSSEDMADHGPDADRSEECKQYYREGGRKLVLFKSLK